MKKTAAAILLILLLPIFSAQLTYADEYNFSTSELDYFALDEPISVCTDGGKIFIAEKHRIIAYYNDTFDATESGALDSITISRINLIGGYLLVLADGNLYPFDAANFVLGEKLNVADGNFVSDFDVEENYFAVVSGGNLYYYCVTDLSNLTFEQRAIGGKNPVPVDDGAIEVAISQGAFFVLANGKITKITFTDLNYSVEELSNDFTGVSRLTDGASCLYYKKSGGLYKLYGGAETSVYELGAADGLTSIYGFYLFGGNILVCDAESDCVREINAETYQLTDFTISFTKINIPDGFEIVYTDSPKYITVESGTVLYSVNLPQSKTQGYFVYDGAKTQVDTEHYAVIADVGDKYYLTAGSCFALVIKSDYETQTLPFSQSELLNGYITNDSPVYKFPVMGDQLTNGELKKYDQVSVIKQTEFGGINYYIVGNSAVIGYIPVSFVKEELKETLSQDKSYSATVKVEGGKLYSDVSLTAFVKDVDGGSSVIVYSETDGALYVRIGDDCGYISKNTCVEQGFYTKRKVAIVLICALALTVTAVFFEIKYLYTKKKM